MDSPEQENQYIYRDLLLLNYYLKGKIGYLLLSIAAFKSDIFFPKFFFTQEV
jgi:hypothetical protein